MAITPKDGYLILYNSACCAGWAFVLKLGFTSLASGGSLSGIYALEGLSSALTIVQSAALLEIVHAAIGFVRSPVVVTSMQVGSRIAALFAVNNSPAAQGKFTTFLIYRIILWRAV